MSDEEQDQLAHLRGLLKKRGIMLTELVKLVKRYIEQCPCSPGKERCATCKEALKLMEEIEQRDTSPGVVPEEVK